MDGRKNDFIKEWLETGCKERATDRPVIIFGNFYNYLPITVSVKD